MFVATWISTARTDRSYIKFLENKNREKQQSNEDVFQSFQKLSLWQDSANSIVGRVLRFLDVSNALLSGVIYMKHDKN